MHTIESEGEDYMVLQLYHDKTFHRVSNEYLINVMNNIRFNPYFVKWISIFYKDIISSVKCNEPMPPYLN